MDNELLTPDFSLPSAPPPPADQVDVAAQEDVLGSLADHPGYPMFRNLFLDYIAAYKSLATVDMAWDNQKVGEETKVAIRVASALEQLLGQVEEAHEQSERRRGLRS